jgi:TPR repeat protein
MKHRILILIVTGVVLLPSLILAQSVTPSLATLKAAAEQGDVSAQAELGDVYRGRFDYEHALLWYRKAAERGNAHAQSEAGRILIGYAGSYRAKPEVRSVHADEAIKLLLQASNQGDQSAQFELGKQFEAGNWIKEDKVEAYKWYKLAMRRGSPIAPKDLAGKFALDALILKLTQDQIADGEKRVAAFAPSRSASAELPEPAWVKEIKLQGLSGPENRRLAIINGQTFQKGDEGEIKAGSRKVKIKCLEVGANSATVSIASVVQPRELKLETELPAKK